MTSFRAGLVWLLFALAQLPVWVMLFVSMPPEKPGWPLLSALLLASMMAIFAAWLLLRSMRSVPATGSSLPDSDGADHASLTHATRLPGRRQLEAKLRDAIDHARHKDQKFALLMLDTDDFRDINDTLGHAVGDRVLIELGRRLRRVAHGTDTVAHFGGDDFVLLIENVRDLDQVERATQDMHAALSQSMNVEDLDLHLDVHFGVVIYPTHGETPEVLLRRADIAKYDAKRSHEIAHFYQSGRDARDLYHLSLAHDLHDAVPDQELRLYYQPRLSISSGRIEDMEGLLRWQHPKHGLVPPDDFIPLAESSGSIKALTDWALHEALRQLRAWLDAGTSVSVGLNFSALDLGQQDIPDRLQAYLAEFDVSPERLIIEVTETAVMRDIDRALLMLQRLKNCGIRLAIDDYGSGYSSLAYLKRMPVDELKIDKCFVMDMAKSSRDALIVRSTIDLAHAMNLKVVAEGVEDADSLRMLQEFGCDSAQGYLISKPIPGKDLTVMLQRDQEHNGLPELTAVLRQTNQVG